jgi:chromosome transmission fidelity protein 1
MEPISEFKEQLFISAGATPERIVTFSCDHVIPKENILTCILKTGPTGQEFEFNYQLRENPEIVCIQENILFMLKYFLKFVFYYS